MSELSIFVDESGDQSGSRFYLITLILHDQSTDFYGHEIRYRQVLTDCRIPDIPFHMGPLLHGHEDYQNTTLDDRKRMLSKFAVFAQNFPFSYKTFAYEKSDSPSMDALLHKMERDLNFFLYEHLAYFQAFDKIKIYYDDGQAIVTNALHAAVECVLAKDAIIYKDASPKNYRLFQLADYVCTLELTAMKFQAHDARPTDHLFFGDWGSFKKNYLKKVRKHLL